jgi:hypothetical protein
VNIQQDQQVYVYLLWCSDGERVTLLDVYTHKVQAEADLRVLQQDNYQGYAYRITERHTVPHDNNR